MTARAVLIAILLFLSVLSARSQRCEDSRLPFRVTVLNQKKLWTCKYVARKNKESQFPSPELRCDKGLNQVATHCPKTCSKCKFFTSHCKDATKNFRLPDRTMRSCKWVKNRNTRERCKIAGVKSTCRATCGVCTSTESLSTSPSTSPSTTSDESTDFPSGFASESPSKEPSDETPSSEPSDEPFSFPSGSPSSTPSEEPSDEPSMTSTSPTPIPTISPTVMEVIIATPQPSSSPTQCPSGHSSFVVEFKTDQNSGKENKIIIHEKKDYETYHKLVSTSKFAKNKLKILSYCLEDNKCYRFRMRDYAGDGICCDKGNGYYKLFYNGTFNKFSLFMYRCNRLRHLSHKNMFIS